MTAFIKLLHPDAKVPVKGSPDAAGYDLYSGEDVLIPKGKRRLVRTGLAIKSPPGYYGRIASRSGLALKHGITVLGGVIDHDYTGEIGVILLNTTADDEFFVSKGDRIAQIIFEAYANADLMVVDELPKTERGAGGFESTGRQ